METTEIDLHEAALLKAQKHDLPTILTTDAISKCMAAANDIVDAIQFSHRVKDRKLESFRQLNNFQVWPCTRAIQLSCHILKQGVDDITPFIHILRVLSSYMKTLVDPELITPGLLKTADARVAEFTQLTATFQA